MRRHRITVGTGILAAALSLAACGTTPPPGIATPSASGSPTSVSAPPTPTPAVTPSASPTPTPTPSRTPTRTPTASPTPSKPSATGFQLSGTGLGGMKWGATADEVEALLNAEFGAPSEVYVGLDCELNPSSPWSRTLSYGALGVHFVANGTSRNAAKFLRSWSLGLEGDIDPRLRIANNLPTFASFADLTKKYPEGTLEDSPFADGTQIFTHPNGIRYIGEQIPDVMQAGELGSCD
ncbi:MAG: hypothetical protein VB036_01430 [Propionicimonas sp.]|nr:hypothetical protein [Propionicimonas sp.]